jgi:hypothetical protein
MVGFLLSIFIPQIIMILQKSISILFQPSVSTMNLNIPEDTPVFVNMIVSLSDV